jgi:hypothetical protein
VHVLRAIEAGRAAWANAVGTKDGDSAIFEGFGGHEVVVVLRGEVDNDFAGCEFYLGTSLAAVGDVNLGAL